MRKFQKNYKYNIRTGRWVYYSYEISTKKKKFYPQNIDIDIPRSGGRGWRGGTRSVIRSAAAAIFDAYAAYPGRTKRRACICDTAIKRRSTYLYVCTYVCGIPDRLISRAHRDTERARGDCDRSDAVRGPSVTRRHRKRFLSLRTTTAIISRTFGSRKLFFSNFLNFFF